MRSVIYKIFVGEFESPRKRGRSTRREEIIIKRLQFFKK